MMRLTEAVIFRSFDFLLEHEIWKVERQDFINMLREQVRSCCAFCQTGFIRRVGDETESYEREASYRP
jgi:hypothetical protein